MGLLAICFFPAKSDAWTVTVTGTIFDDLGNSNGNGINGTGIFGTPGTSLVGDAYTESITTNPLLNSHVDSTSSFLESYGGSHYGGGSLGAAYSIAVTVNGFTYSETELNPFINYAYLLDLSNGLAPNGILYQQAFQEVQSSGCSTVYGVCTSSYILAYSQQTPFVFRLDFNHPLHSTDLDPGSNTYFLFNDGPDLTTGFYGSIDSVRVHPERRSTSSRRSPTLRHRHRRLRSARLAQEAEGAGSRLVAGEGSAPSEFPIESKHVGPSQRSKAG